MKIKLEEKLSTIREISLIKKSKVMETEISFLEVLEKKNLIIAANTNSEFIVFSYYTMQ